jgi:ABC-2 type transport system ATP-binding protein
MIHVSGLTKDYGPRRAINDLNFNAKKGEILGFLGPNGAGKTTTMRILTGYMPPTSGKVQIGGYDIIENSLEVRRIVGYLPETVPLYNDMTTTEYLEYMANLRHLPNARKHAKETLAVVGLSDRANGYIANLSKGMRQRLGLAQALIHQPDVLILDEPTIGLDPGQVVHFRDLIREIGRDRTVLLSTHILPEAQQVCDRVLIINKGHIIAEDSPRHLQSSLTGSQRVSVQINGDSQELVPFLSNLPSMLSVVQRTPDTIEYESAPGQDIRGQVARTIVNAGFDLLQLQTINLSLEEIFLQLTREDSGETSPAQLEEAEPNQEDNE